MRLRPKGLKPEGFQGFPRGTLNVPVPSPVFGPLLEAIDDLAELKCTLRVLWLLHQRKGHPRFVTLREMVADRVLLAGLQDSAPSPQEAIEAALCKAVQRGTFLSTKVEKNGNTEELYLLNSDTGRKALEAIENDQIPIRTQVEGDEAPVGRAQQKLSIFALYEENVGLLTPLLAEELKDAEASYPWPWIEEAFKLAVELNRRNWRYISRILERWATEGKDSGEFGRHTAKGNRTEHFEEYLQRRTNLR